MGIDFDTLTSANLTGSGTKVSTLPDEYGFYGQTFTATSSNLATIEFAVDHASGSGAVELTVMIATIRFDGGGFHPDEVVYKSALITINPNAADGAGSIVSIDTSGLSLVAGQQYVILFNANSGEGPEGDGSLNFVTNPQNDSEYFVYSHTANQDDVAAFEQNGWYQNPADGSGWGDTAIRLTYGQTEGTPGNDVLIGSSADETINGYAGNDYLAGAGGNDVLNGSDGNDRLDGGEGDDILNGGSGVDGVSYIDATAGVYIDLTLTGAQDTGSAGIDTLSSIENVSGSESFDVIYGNNSNNLLSGRGGPDTLLVVPVTTG